MKSRIGRATYTSGFAGVVVLIFMTLIPALMYIGRQGQVYSILNHYISELGEYNVSLGAPLFNFGLLCGGFFLTIFLASLGLYLRTWLSLVAAVIGVFSGINAMLIGVFPMNFDAMHRTVASRFFFSGMVSIALFTIDLFMRRNSRLPRWLATPGFVSVICFFAFLASIFYAPVLPVSGATISNRPMFWATPFLEWAVFFSVLAWALLISWQTRLQESRRL